MDTKKGNRNVLALVGLVALVGAMSPRALQARRYGEATVGALDVTALDFSSDNQRKLNRAYRHFARSHFMRFLKFLTSDVSWIVEGSTEEIPFAGIYDGGPGFLDYVLKLRKTIRLQEWTVRYVLEDGDQVHVHLLQRGQARNTGKDFSMEMVHLWAFDESGKIAAFREYYDTYAMSCALSWVCTEDESLVENAADYQIPESSYEATADDASALYSAFFRGDVEFLASAFSDELVWILAGPSHVTPFAGTFYGYAGFFEYYMGVVTSEQFLEAVVSNIVVDGSRVDAQFYERVVVFDTGEEFTCNVLHSFNFGEDGGLVSFRSYNDTYNVAEAFIPDTE